MANCEVVTEWASGCSWTEALAISGSPPGDLARILSRALDALRQLGNLPFTPIRKKDLDGGSGEAARISSGIHPDVRRLCRDAARLINRYPVKDPLTFAAVEDEIEEEEEEDAAAENEDEEESDSDDESL